MDYEGKLFIYNILTETNIYNVIVKKVKNHVDMKTLPLATQHLLITQIFDSKLNLEEHDNLKTLEIININFNSEIEALPKNLEHITIRLHFNLSIEKLQPLNKLRTRII